MKNLTLENVRTLIQRWLSADKDNTVANLAEKINYSRQTIYDLQKKENYEISLKLATTILESIGYSAVIVRDFE